MSGGTATRVQIPFVDLRVQHRELHDEIGRAVSRILDDTSFVLGSDVAAFESEFATYLASGDGAIHAIGVASGLDALHLALVALGIGRGDEVIVPAHTFAASALGVRASGATIVLADCDPHTMLLNVEGVKRALTPRTRAILPVHLYGRVCEMDPILALARERGLRVVEDAAQAHGARLAGRAAGTFGDAGCFSFYPSKNLGACGDAGMIVTRDPKTAEAVKRLRNYGQSVKYHHDVSGTNSRLDSIQAAILRIKLRHLDAWNERRRVLAARYDRALEGLPIERPAPAPPASHVHHLYVVRVPERDRVRDALLEQGIETGVHYPKPIHFHGAFSDLGYREGSFVESERAAREIVSLPLYPEMPDEWVDDVASTLRRILR
ncbi:MAG: DegT/DnrJ/EryC1/StrS family aminotransferase [Planctomycetes bacterium]|nr:DegT/DnrJ/EryC1/StrS family aminotransferase [Planctomycetota bacterium]MBI3845851.1 DegT/DnrJ/EryC1/StrS family aminotransferase [Planctomycetota bacterium]